MAMSRRIHRAINALTQLSPDVNKTYKVERGLEKMSSAVRAKPPGYEIWDRDVFNRESGQRVPVRIFKPNKKSMNSLLLFFHGGGWVLGNIDSYSKLCLTLARQTGWSVISVDYRLAPEHPFPAGLEDCYAVARELYSGVIDGVDNSNIVMIGDSAGANLSAALSAMARDRGEFMPPAQILLYPATYNNHTEESPFKSVAQNGSGYLLTTKRINDLVNMYMSGRDDFENPYFAPLLAKDFTGLPRTLIITAEYDPLRDEGECYGQKLLTAGGDVTVFRISDTLHGFMSLSPRFRPVKEAYTAINAFLAAETERREKI